MRTKDLGNGVIAEYEPKTKVVKLTAQVGFGGFSIIFLNEEAIKNLLEWIRVIRQEEQNAGSTTEV